MWRFGIWWGAIRRWIDVAVENVMEALGVAVVVLFAFFIVIAFAAVSVIAVIGSALLAIIEWLFAALVIIGAFVAVYLRATVVFALVGGIIGFVAVFVTGNGSFDGIGLLVGTAIGLVIDFIRHNRS